MFINRNTLLVTFLIAIMTFVISGCDGPEADEVETATPRQQEVSTHTPTPMAQAEPQFTVARDRVNVRNGPGTNFPVIGQVTLGMNFVIIESNQAGDWYKFCCVDGEQGWIYAQLLTVENEHLLAELSQPVQPATSTPKPASTETPQPPLTATPLPTEVSSPSFVVAGEVVNVRGGPGTNFPVIGQITAGMKFSISGKNQSGDWYEFCCVEGQQVWIYGPLLQVENANLVTLAKSIPSPPPTSTPAPQPTQAEALAGITVRSENRCSPYSSDDYRYPQSVEQQIVAAMGGRIYSPYTGQTFGSTGETDIEHIVARSEAHDSGLCAGSAQTRLTFARDLLNLTLADPSTNRHQKSAKDVAEWLPQRNSCWYVNRVVEVKRSYGLTMDPREAEAVRSVLAACSSTEMVFYSSPQPAPPTATPVPAQAPPSQQDALSLYDDNGNGRITCAEARRHGIAPVPSSHPAYKYMNDRDKDGVVCE